MANILINNCGSQAVEIIDLIKRDKSNKVIYLTHQDKTKFSVIADLVLDDYKGLEDFNIQNYIDFLLDTCAKYQIQVFIPFNNMVNLIEYKYRFEDSGVKFLACSNAEMFKILNSKTRTYELIENDLQELKSCLPVYFKVKSVMELKEAFCEMIRSAGKEVCIKYAEDIASNSFRIVNFDRHSLDELEVKGLAENIRLKHLIDYTVLIDMFTDAYGFDEFDRDLLVMEYISGKEISCDCLQLDKYNKYIIIPRIKESGNVQRIVNDKTLINICKNILIKTKYDGPCNIQFKGDKLLEVNTRMSGGIMLASYATGINLPLLAVKNSLGSITEKDLSNLDFVEKSIKTEKHYVIK